MHEGDIAAMGRISCLLTRAELLINGSTEECTHILHCRAGARISRCRCYAARLYQDAMLNALPYTISFSPPSLHDHDFCLHCTTRLDHNCCPQLLQLLRSLARSHDDASLHLIRTFSTRLPDDSGDDRTV